MEVRNCKMCGRLFNVLNNERICPACQKKLEDKFHEVKQYLEDHPGASVEQTATDNDINQTDPAVGKGRKIDSFLGYGSRDCM